MSKEEENIIDYSDFFHRIGYKFSDISLLTIALTHPSMNAKKGVKNIEYQRLEFLGDRILGFILGKEVFFRFKDQSEGLLAKQYSYLASGKILSEIAVNIGISDQMILSHGAEKFAGRENKSNLENTLEALIGAIFLDSSIIEVEKFILNNWKDYIESVNIDIATDPKSFLQEYSQMKFNNLPQYKVVEKKGNEHEPIFRVKVYIVGISGEFFGENTSKKEAEKAAAENMINALRVSNLI